MKKVIITGANGYIAYALIKQLKSLSVESLLISRSELTEKFKNFKYKSLKCDISNENPWNDILSGGETIIHLSSETSNNISNKDPLINWNVNVKPIYDIANASKLIEEKPTVIFTSTVTVFGLTPKIKIDEKYIEKPTTIYDFHKFNAEKLLNYFHNRKFIKSICLRLSNVYGPSGQKQASDRGILNSSIKNALRGSNLLIYKNGNFIRDFIFIDDVVRSIIAVMLSTNNPSGKSYIVSSGVGYGLLDILKIVKKEIYCQLGLKAIIKEIPQPPNILDIDKRDFIGSNNSFCRDYNWEPKVSIYEGIEKTVDYYQKHLH